MNQKKLESMARFYLKELFFNIPYIPVNFSTELRKSAIGGFEIVEGDSYDPDEDDLLNAYEYRPRYTITAAGSCGYDKTREYSYSDPLNHPSLAIKIHPKCKKDPRLLVSTLLHELLHYYCWYTGLEYHDDSRDFLDKCKEMGLCDNYSHFRWNGTEWTDTYDYSKMDRYIRMFISKAESKEKVA